MRFGKQGRRRRIEKALLEVEPNWGSTELASVSSCVRRKCVFCALLHNQGSSVPSFLLKRRAHNDVVASF